MSENDATAAMDAFLQAYLEDLRAGRASPLEVYQRRFSGHEDAVGAAWRECHEGVLPEGNGSAPASFDTIGSYEIVRELGRGGQGIVYLARDTRLRREVALKVFPRNAASSSMALRMRREAEALSRMDDRGICSIYEFGETPREAYLAMRYVRGKTLAEELREEVRDTSGTTPGVRPRVLRILRIIEEVARSIHKAHVIGIVHRDLKPGNIMIDSEDHPVVLDFGLARDEEAAGPTLTQTGDMLGTPAYMSPEQISGRVRDSDARTDVYSLGVCLYECLTLRRPFAAPTREELIRQITSEEAADPRRTDRRIPKDVATVTAIAMAKDLRRRYASTLDLAEDLRRVQAGEPILARRPGPLEKALRYVRRRPLHSALGLTGLVAVVLGGYLALHWSDLKAEDERRRAVAVEETLEAALDSVGSRAAVEASLARLDAAEKAAGTTTDVTVGRVLSLVRIGQLQDALAILDAKRDQEAAEPALKWARWRVMLQLQMPGAREYRESLGEPPDALSALIAGLEAADNLAHMSPEILKPEVARIHRTVLAAPVPRRAFHLLLVSLAAEAGDTATAMDTAEAMLRLWPTATSSWTAMGHACQLPDPVRAIRCFRKAIELGADPRTQGVTVLLANSYSELGDEEACVRVYREAVGAPGSFSTQNLALAFYNLGESLYQLRDWEGCVEANRRVLELTKEEQTRLTPMALCNLAQSLIHTGRLAAALETLERGHAMGVPMRGWDFKSADWIQTMKLHIALAGRIPAAADADPPDDDGTPSQWAAAAVLAGHYATAARWFRQVHGPDATIPDEQLQQWATRLFAVTAALRAAEGEGADTQSSADTRSAVPASRVALRELAFTWLAQELAAVRQGLDAKTLTAPKALRRLQRWSSGSGLALIRTESAVRQWPEAQRARVRELWTQWEALVARVRPAY